jgi:D-alanyl-lipoteichoic acid acyltransferase DltB (MBOAT superfamily)
MLFNSYVFLLAFLPVALAGYALLSRVAPRRVALGFLAACSLFYYGYWAPRYLLLIAASIVGNYLIGRQLTRMGPGRRRGLTLTLSVAANLALLGYFKYAGFAVETANVLSGAAFVVPEIVLPIGISFFTFQQIAFLVDTSRGITGEQDFVDYCLFVTFFPQLIAGPIVHHAEMMPQFLQRGQYRANRADLSVGLTVFAIGLCKKVIIADTMATVASPTFAAVLAGHQPTFGAAWVAVLSYAFQIYFDFSGYSDMALGLGRCFGITLPLNFDAPYRAASIIDFWRRWHMTLSRFLRDYLYIPLGGSRRGRGRRHVNLFLTMLLGGLWHGAGWTFVLWGGLHGLYLGVNHGWRALCERHGWQAPANRALRGALHAGSVLLTFLAVCMAWVLFKAESVSAAGRFYAAMAGLNGFETAAGVDLRNAGAWAMFVPAVVWLFPRTHHFMQAATPALGVRPPATLSWWQWRPHPLFAWGAALLLFYAMLCIGVRTTEFIYYQF